MFPMSNSSNKFPENQWPLPRVGRLRMRDLTRNLSRIYEPMNHSTPEAMANASKPRPMLALLSAALEMLRIDIAVSLGLVATDNAGKKPITAVRMLSRSIDRVDVDACGQLGGSARGREYQRHGCTPKGKYSLTPAEL